MQRPYIRYAAAYSVQLPVATSHLTKGSVPVRRRQATLPHEGHSRLRLHLDGEVRRATLGRRTPHTQLDGFGGSPPRRI